MSIFHPATFTCSQCGAETSVERTASVNADLRPDLRAAILDGSFQATKCPKCGANLRLPPHLTYLELGRQMWIAAEPASQIEDWNKIEDGVWPVYDRAFGSGAAPAARELTVRVRPRLVFGWPALREKLIAADLGLDDITLELLKMSILRHVDGPPLADETELRLIGAEGDALRFAWFHQVSEEQFAQLDVPRDAYDGIVADAQTWAPLREKLAGVFLVDLRRFIAGPEIARAT
jgi:CpXC protein